MGNCSSTSNCNPCGPDFSAINQLATKAGAYARQANTYATNAENSWLEFNALYLGAFAVAPTVDNEGDPLQTGALYWNTGSNTMFVWNGTIWVAADFNEFTPFLATGTTTPRNLVTRTADVVNVKDFGAVGDGVADDTAAIQAALNFVGIDGGTLMLNNGTYLVTGLTIPANVTFFGQSWNAVIKSQIAGSTDFIVIDSASNVTIEGIAFDMNQNPGLDGNGAVCIKLSSTTSATNSTTIKNCKFTNADIRPFIDVRTTLASENLLIENNEFYGQPSLIPKTAPNIQNTQAIRALCGAIFTNMAINNNYFNLIEFATQIRPTTPLAVKSYDVFLGLSWSNNVVTNVLDDPNIGATPLEIFGATNVVVEGNKIDSGGRGLGAAWVKNGVYNNNTLENQTIYFIEIVAVDGITISNNTALNCKRFAAVTGISTDPGAQNVSITGNLIKGGNLGIAGFNTTQNGFAITMIPLTTTGHKNWVISDNLFLDFLHSGEVLGSVGAGSIIRVDDPLSSDFLIANNNIIANNASMTVSCVNIAQGTNIKVIGNSIVRNANISTATYNSSLSIFTFITSIPNNTANVSVEDNFISFTGTDTRTGSPGAIGIGHNSSAGTLAGGRFVGNKLLGGYSNSLRLQYTSSDIIVEDNDLSQSTGAPFYNAAIQFRRTQKIVNLSAIPTVGTWAVGDIVFNTVPVVGQPIGWSCSVAGTPGTWLPMPNF
jgi:hypothetical protein